MLRLSGTYDDSKQYDLAIAMADRVLAMPDAAANLKKIAADEKARAVKLKAGQK